MPLLKYDIVPVPKPRMTRSDKWKRRPATEKYWKFTDEVRKASVMLYDDDHIIFNLPMPQSWAKKKKNEHRGKLHKQKPDLDNLCKAMLDAIFDDDSHISVVLLEKRWADFGSIHIIR